MRLLKFGFVIFAAVVIAVGCTKKVAAIKAANSITTNPVPGYPQAENLNNVTLPPGLGGGGSTGAASDSTSTTVSAPTQVITATTNNAFLPKARPRRMARSGKHHGKRHHHKRKH